RWHPARPTTLVFLRARLGKSLAHRAPELRKLEQVVLSACRLLDRRPQGPVRRNPDQAGPPARVLRLRESIRDGIPASGQTPVYAEHRRVRRAIARIAFQME